MSGYSALADCRTTLCELQEHCKHSSPCCGPSHYGDCTCPDNSECCACETAPQEPCAQALEDARNYLAFGGITHDLHDVLLRDERNGADGCPECGTGTVIAGTQDRTTGHVPCRCTDCTWTA